ncbi:unnamed protein product, partial [marine sediment metagenome]
MSNEKKKYPGRGKVKSAALRIRHYKEGLDPETVRI